ncbi:MAG: two-component sensor histidine kinase [Anaerolineaceae bacterium]|nr:MAG: two-component sensor histidine kinase [Anaerolineaceae bacterium]
MKKSLGVRLFLSYLVVILVGVVVLAAATQFTLLGAYGRHLGLMEEMVSATSESGMGLGMGRGQGQGSSENLFSSFRSSFNEALVWAGLAALAAALAVSLLVSRGISAPIRAMTVASQRISEGRYEERVRAAGSDELGQLAGSFNRMAEKLEQTESLRRRLIGDVAHELRTPLTAIKGSMEGLMDGVLPPTPETFDQIHQEADRLSRLVDDLQELSRVEAGAFQLDRKPAAAAGLVNFVLKRLSRQFEAKGVALTSDLPASLPPILADEDRIGQVLLNLAGNALHYTPAGGQVVISAEARGGEVVFAVADNGIGIPAEHLPHIFDRFYRVDKSRSRAGGGSGIGLTISKHFVEAHGGKIWVESAGENRGSIFRFTLPEVL